MTWQIPRFRTMTCAALCAAVIALAAAPAAQEGPDASRRKAYEELLDTNVRDGWVYYRALRLERARLDSYVNSLAAVNLDALRREDQIALWLNAYNAIVLQTVVEH